MDIGLQEIAIILVIALIVFGPKKLPEIGRSLGRGLRELRRASNELMSSFDQSDDSEDRAGASAQKEGDTRDDRND